MSRQRRSDTTPKAEKTRPTFLESVGKANHAAVAGAGQPGLKALGGHAAKVQCSTPRRITGSIDIDTALASDPAFAQSNRWDYGFGFMAQDNDSTEIAVWVEVHSADTGEVSTMIKKKKWLRDYLISQCEDLWKLTAIKDRAVEEFHWVASKGVHINRNSSQARALSQAGISWPQSVLKLP